ncbi:hypothetical protein SAMD00019534_016780 [Acytostelium subglobosum LB1]|uniref:hypothetical protein n=1 Tax=Acytostelium subglobosum LB1 TaxID=1410327 RepID=UPI000644BF7F|nr:hypothetical protein SAMD00019534_016780 [Acytostelium subglobosum LB1]GAM18503.1 hypothetical protein SAMD00019534_016780 [Acytostelium subglobosum LB1]|eukprot:XP_012757723.1 hypothetical protein SAMD00019534_016780 [Acytostelium subglobosum LB1]
MSTTSMDNIDYVEIDQQERIEQQEEVHQDDEVAINNNDNIDNISSSTALIQQPPDQEKRKSRLLSCHGKWTALKPFILYCTFSFLFSFDPSEPYLVDYLTNVLHVPQRVVYQEIFPTWTYAYFCFLLIFGFLGEIIGYKFVIIIGMAAKVATTIILLSTSNLGWLIFEQVTDGMSFAAYIVFLAYIYFSLQPDEYQQMACRVNVGYIVGVVSSGLLGQLLVNRVSLVTLLCMALATNIASLVIALSFNNYRVETRFQLRCFLIDLRQAYRNTDILHWYIWSGVAISIHQIVLTYWQSLFLETSNEQNWNGYISSSAYFFAAFVTTIPARLGNKINDIKNLILVLFGLVGSILLIIMGIGPNIYVSTICFVIYNCCFEFMSPIVNVQIAKKLSSRIGLLFSFNIMIALAVQMIIQLSVGNKMLDLNINHQFIYFGSCLLLLSIGFTIFFTSSWLHNRTNIYKQSRLQPISHPVVDDQDSNSYYVDSSSPLLSNYDHNNNYDYNDIIINN